MKKILLKMKMKKLIKKGYEYYTITENGRITSIQFYKGV